jgi:hypothetical protein
MSSELLTFQPLALGVIWIVIGTAIALLGGSFAVAFLKNSAFFQQVRFALYDAGFALIVVGFTAVIAASFPASTSAPNIMKSKQSASPNNSVIVAPGGYSSMLGI